MHGLLHVVGPGRQVRRAGIPGRIGFRHGQAALRRVFDERVLVVQAPQMAAGRAPQARRWRQGVRQRRHMQRFFRDRQDDFDTFPAHDSAQRIEIGGSVRVGSGNPIAARHGPRRAAEMPAERVRHQHAATHRPAGARQGQRLGQAAQGQQYGFHGLLPSVPDCYFVLTFYNVNFHSIVA